MILPASLVSVDDRVYLVQRSAQRPSIWPAVALGKVMQDDADEYRTHLFSQYHPTVYGLFPFLLAPEPAPGTPEPTPAPHRTLKPRKPGSAAWRRYQRRQAR